MAHMLLVECCELIGDSPDLTPSHAESLILAYQANYEKEVKFYYALRQPISERTPTVYRGAGGGILTPQQSVIRTAQVARQAGVEEEQLQGLIDLSKTGFAYRILMRRGRNPPMRYSMIS